MSRDGPGPGAEYQARGASGEVNFAAVREDRFYILTHPEGKEAVRTRMEDILQERSPTPPGP